MQAENAVRTSPGNPVPGCGLVRGLPAVLLCGSRVLKTLTSGCFISPGVTHYHHEIEVHVTVFRKYNTAAVSPQEEPAQESRGRSGHSAG